LVSWCEARLRSLGSRLPAFRDASLPSLSCLRFWKVDSCASSFFSQSVRRIKRPHFTTSTAWTRYGTPFPEDSLLTRSRYSLLLHSFRRSRIPRLVFPEGLNARRTARRDRERLGTARHAVGGFHIKPAAEFPSLAGRRVVIGRRGVLVALQPAGYAGNIPRQARQRGTRHTSSGSHPRPMALGDRAISTGKSA